MDGIVATRLGREENRGSNPQRETRLDHKETKSTDERIVPSREHPFCSLANGGIFSALLLRTGLKQGRNLATGPKRGRETQAETATEVTAETETGEELAMIEGIQAVIDCPRQAQATLNYVKIGAVVLQ
jgi:hypothetical protein